MTKQLHQWWRIHRRGLLKKAGILTAYLVAMSLITVCVLAYSAHIDRQIAAREHDVQQYTALLQTFQTQQHQFTDTRSALLAYEGAHGANPQSYSGTVLAPYVTILKAEQTALDREVKAAVTYNALADRPPRRNGPILAPPDDMPQHLTPDAP